MPRSNALQSFTRAPWPLLFSTAGLGLLLSITSAGSTSLPALCSAATWPSSSGVTDIVALIVLLNSPARLAADWMLMLLAMMPPLLVMPLMHVWRASLPCRRLRAIGCFVLGYVSVWMASGPILIALSLIVTLVAGNAAFATALLLAIAWSASPWQRAALNHNHRLTRIGLFGWAADRDALLFGIRHAGWCVVSCWPWMLVPLVAGRWHIAAMMACGAVMLIERLRAPGRARWHWPTIVSLFESLLVLLSRKGRAAHG